MSNEVAKGNMLNPNLSIYLFQAENNKFTIWGKTMLTCLKHCCVKVALPFTVYLIELKLISKLAIEQVI